MRDFNSGKKFGNRGFGGGEGGRPSMHQATCSDCGAPCEVPFRPTPGKPVYCNNCFKKEGGESRFEKRDFGRKSFGDRQGGFRKSGFGDRGDRQMFEATCAECGQRCEVPFKPTGEKPVYCKECFGGGKKGPSASGKQGVTPEQFDQLNKKLDRIIKELEILKQKKTFTVEKQVKKPEEPKMGKTVEKAEDLPVRQAGKKPASKKAAKTAKKKGKK